ncbi:MAG: hypothetical protein CM15mP47_5340 [Methanobacteriota archaeon]|nr:MAG: hypothetical protein CM15mP47_5340 [Euryarchaeota archaeon]
MSKGTPSMGRRQKTTHISGVDGAVEMPTTSKKAYVLRADTGQQPK